MQIVNLIYLGNLADMDPTEGNNQSENAATVLNGRTFTTLKTVSVDTGDTGDGWVRDNGELTSFQTTYGGSGPITYNLGAGPVTTTLDGTVFANTRAVLTTSITTGTLQTTVIQMANGDAFLANYFSNGALNNLSISSVTIDSISGDSYSAFNTSGGLSGTTTTGGTTPPPTNSAPIFTNVTSGQTINMAENTTFVVDANAIDPDGNAMTFSISGGADAARFSIDAATGVLSLASAPDFEGAKSAVGNDQVYDVTVRVADGNGGLRDAALSINVTNVAEGATPNGTVDGTDVAQLMNIGFVDTQGDIIDGADGIDDIINGAGGNDTIVGGAGNDSVTGGLGDDQISGDGQVATITSTTFWTNDSSNRIYRATVDSSGLVGTQTLVGTSSIAFADIAMRADGRLYGSSFSGQLYQINTTTAAATLIGNIGTGIFGAGLSFGGDGLLYSTNGSTIIRFSADAPTVVTSVWTNPAGGSAAGDFLTVGDKMYVSWSVGGVTSLLRLDLNSYGAVTGFMTLGQLPATSFGLAIGPDGSIYTSSGSGLFRLDVPTSPLNGGTGAISLTAVSGTTLSSPATYNGATSSVESTQGVRINGDDTIDGGSGNDSIFGGGGHDSVMGGLGNDVISGDGQETTTTPIPPVQTVWSNDNTNRIYRTTLDSSGLVGTQTLVGISNVSFTDIAMRADGRLYGSSFSGQLFQINTTTAQATLIGNIGTGIFGSGLSFGADGLLYSTNGATIIRFSADAPTVVTSVWTNPAGGSAAGDFLTVGNKMYVSWSVGGATSLLRLDLDASGNITGATTLGLLPGTSFGLALGANGSIYTASGSGLYRLDVPASPLAGGTGTINLTLVSGSTAQGGGSYFGATSNVEATQGQGTIIITPGNDTLAGGEGSDTLFGNGGADRLIVGPADRAEGGDGDDLFVVDRTLEGTGGITVIGGEVGETAGDVLDLRGLGIVALNQTGAEAGTATYTNAFGQSVTVTYSEIESVLRDLGDGFVDGANSGEMMGVGYTDAQGDLITENADSIRGNDGNDTISAGGGNDTIDGGLGDDIIVDGLGRDTIYGGDGNDVIDDAPGVNATADATYADGGAGNDSLSGSSAADMLLGGTGYDSIAGEDGNDSLDGGAGNDSLFGGAGNDSLSGGDGDERIALTAGSGNDTILGGEAGETLGDSIDATPLTTNITLNFTGAEAGTITDGTSTTSFGQIETFALGSGNDTVLGASGSDSVDAGAGNDSMSGGAGNDALAGGVGDDTLDGGAGNDSLSAADGDDRIVLNSGSGSDTIVGGEAGETLGDSVDATLLTANTTLIFTGAEAGTITDGTSTSTFAETEMFALGVGHDTVLGGGGNESVDAGGGDDSLAGGAGNDSFAGGVGNDALAGGAGNDSLSAGDGDDRIILTASFGNDTILGGQVSETLGDSIDATTVTANTTLTFTGAGVGTLADGTSASSFSQIETFALGSGNDTVLGASGNDSVDAGAGNDSMSGGAGNDALAGGVGNDTLAGGAGNDSLSGGDGDDRFTVTAGFGNETILGGSAGETLGDGIDATTVTANTTLTFTGAGLGTLADGTSTSSFSQVETFALGSGNDTVLGASGSDSVDAGAGNDSMSGGAGNDALAGGVGNDTLAGGAGNDSLSAADGDDVITLNADFGNDTMLGGEADETVGDGVDATLLTADTTVTFTGAEAGTITDGTSTSTFAETEMFALGLGHDTVLGGAGNESVDAGGGDDSLSGGAGNDSFAGGVGDDALAGGAGNDSLSAGDGDDRIILTAGFGNDTILGGQVGETLGDGIDATAVTANTTLTFTGAGVGTLADGTSTSSFSQIETFALGSGNDTVLGASGSDSVDAGDGNDSLSGGTGLDTLTGGAGNDVLAGGVGGDALDGGAGIDTADYSASGLGVNVNLDMGTASGGHAGFDTLAGIENLTGSTFADTLTGDAGANVLDGGALNDLLTGGAGADTLIGGTGTDTADYSASAAGVVVNLTTGVGTGGDAAGDALSGIENLTGSGLGDRLTGDTGTNVIYGGDGNDSLNGVGGNDQLFAGDGDDRITLTDGFGGDTVDGGASGGLVDQNLGDLLDMGSLTSAVSVILTGTGAGAATAGSDSASLTGIERFILTGQADLFDGMAGSGAVTVEGGAGDDTFQGGGGDDSLSGSDDRDLFVAITVGDVVDGGEGGVDNDTLDLRGLGNVTIDYALNPENGTVTIFGAGTVALGSMTFRNIETVLMDIQRDGYVDGIATGDLIDGSYIDHDLDQTDANDALLPGAVGNDDYIRAFDGNDTILAGEGRDYVLAGTGDDTIDAGVGNDTILGDTGADTLDGGAGIDRLVGGADGDTYLVDSTTDTIVELVGGGVDIVLSSVSYKLGVLLENLTLTDTGNTSGIGNDMSNRLTGNTGDNVLRGLVGNDTITGNDGADTLDGGLGVDSMVGGAGDDLYMVNLLVDKVVEQTAGGVDTVQSSLTYTLGDNLENLILQVGSIAKNGTGNALDNLIQGNALANDLTGADGNDTLIGGFGIDRMYGGTGADSMVGGVGNDFYTVDTVSDTLVELASGGKDTVRSTLSWVLGAELENLILIGTGNDSGTGNTIDNRIEGNNRGNLLLGLEGNDGLFGRLGNDTLDGGDGNDAMTGGFGNDLYFVDAIGDKTIELSTGGLDSVQSTISYTLGIFVENLTLVGAAAVNGTGNGSANTILGNALDNALKGAEGMDSLIGGDGADTLDGGTEADRLTGGAGDDAYLVDNSGDVVVEAADAGYDTVTSTVDFVLTSDVENLILSGAFNTNGTGSASADRITGSAGNNALSGNAGQDSLYGGLGNDMLQGGDGNDSLVGGAGNDSFVITDLADTLIEVAGGGIDTVQSSITYTLLAEFENLTLTGSGDINATGTIVANVLTGNAGANILTGDDGADSLFGGAGNDQLHGGAGNDSMTGGDGDDSYYLDDAGDRISEGVTGGFDQVYAGFTLTLGSFVEKLTLTGSANLNGTGNALDNVLIGNSGDNLLYGLEGADTLTAGNGDDTLDGGKGTDSLTGGAGDDTYVVDMTSDIIVELTAGGKDTVLALVSYTLADGLENLTLLPAMSGNNGTGNASQNIMIGNIGANLLMGMDGNDTLDGAAGNDTLDGGAGIDSMTGGAGNDTFWINSSGDVLVELAGGGTDSVVSSLSYTLLDDFENLVLTGADHLAGTGNAAANALTGNAGNNLLSGSDGSDTILGGDGADTLDGGTGADSLVGGNGNDSYLIDSVGDRISETTTGGVDTVLSSITFTLGTFVENLTLTGTDAVNATGNTQDNLVTGNAAANVLQGGTGGSDTLVGGAGNDTLDGGSGLGNDSMLGGAGDDQYLVNAALDQVVEAAGQGIDTVLSGVSFTLGDNVENLALSGSGTITGTGNALANAITGNVAANRLMGMDGNDTLTGGAGNDTQTGGAGADHFVFTSIASGLDSIADFNAVDGGAAEGDVLEFVGLLHGTFAYVGTAAFTGDHVNGQARVQGAQVQLDFDGNATTDLTITLTGLTSATQLNALDFLFS